MTEAEFAAVVRALRLMRDQALITLDTDLPYRWGTIFPEAARAIITALALIDQPKEPKP